MVQEEVIVGYYTPSVMTESQNELLLNDLVRVYLEEARTWVPSLTFDLIN